MHNVKSQDFGDDVLGPPRAHCDLATAHMQLIATCEQAQPGCLSISACCNAALAVSRGHLYREL